MKILIIGLITTLLMVVAADISYGQGRGMMGGYGPYGMGSGMMGGGYGCMGPGMMGGYGYGPHGYGRIIQDEQCQKFLKDTFGLRKLLNDKRFEYWEALRDARTKPETITAQEKAIRDLQEQIYSQNPKGCWW